MYVLKPRLSEKAYATAQANNTFVIDVPKELNKHEIAAVVEKQFAVSVASVRVSNHKGKAKRVMNTTGKRYSNRSGTQADVKKAYISLRVGSHLPFFAAEETEAKETTKTNEKKAEKTKTISNVTSKTPKAENKTSHRGLLRNRKAGDK